MTKEEMIAAYQNWQLRLSAYQMALTIIGFDKQTVAPPRGAGYRDKRTAYLAGEYFTIQTDPENLRILKELKDRTDIDPDLARAAQCHYREIMKVVAIPKEEFVSYQELQGNSFEAWRRAKQANDYSIFEPYLKQIIESSRRLVAYRDSPLSLYDRMLDDYETGLTQAEYDDFFSRLKERLVPLIKKAAAARPIPDAFLHQYYSPDEQQSFMKELLAYLGYDPSWGYLGRSEHPFTTGTSINDLRTTTKYLPDNVVSGVLSTVHEVGHAYYTHDVDPKYDGTILLENITSGMHESQSRLAENYLGRSLPFWEANYPKLQKHFPSQLGKVTVEEFVAAINIAKPSLVRTEADELTYPMHILIRYELEKGLFDGSLSTEGLDRAWDRMYEKYLGIRAAKASEGVLQDVHWADGSFGYFPTYALGSAYAAQFYAAMRRSIDVDSCLRNADYQGIIAWLKQNIHRYGGRYEPAEILRRATGQSFDPAYYLDYLERKYTALYHL